MQRKRYALVGCGGRAVMFVDAIAGRYAPYAELVGLCDISPTRMNWHNNRLAQRFGAKPAPTY
ncbi:MAG: gfo/Idh/MocA family oxidoreductase, partial [Verrucomicrobiae bacterium]|nr:gfo/Idh/MocA family oxidoreductase [Verrucomicrobiae bacterium]